VWKVNDSESVWLQRNAWPDVKSYLERHERPIILVPIGSTEQHGPHLPLGVDGYQASDLSEGIAQEAGALTAPPIWYGDANHHLGFPGTISLSTETVISVLTDVYDSLVSHGFEIILTVNGHRIANLPPIEIAMKQAGQRHDDVLFGAIDPLRIGVRAHRRLRDGDPEDGMHGGEFETSFMLYKHPALVNEDEFVHETHDPITAYQSDNLVGLDDMVLTPSTRRIPEDGYLGHVGDPTKASVEKGEQLYAELVASSATFIEEVRSQDGETDASTAPSKSESADGVTEDEP
jgi:creatinine amidohydrolase